MRQGCAEAGGECKAGEAWSRTCTWRILPTADVTLPPIIMEVENLEGVIFHFMGERVYKCLDFKIWYTTTSSSKEGTLWRSFWCCGLTLSTKLVQVIDHWAQEAICGWNYLGPVDAQLSLRRSLTFGRKGQVWRTCMHAQREGGRERERERKWMWEEKFRQSSIEQHAVQNLVTCVFKRGRRKGIESSISLLILTFYSRQV